jgi:hypothetical protein
MLPILADLAVLAILAILAVTACGATDDRTASSPARSTSAKGAPPAAVPPITGPALLTIRFVPTAACAGGQLFVDGVANGTYPVRRHPVPAGRRHIHIASHWDCAGYGDAELELAPGIEVELEPGQFR